MDSSKGDDGMRTTRRDFVKKTSLAAGALAAGEIPAVYAGGQEQTITAGLIGCGGRGTGAAGDFLGSSPNVRIVAAGDAFKDRVDNARKQLSKNESFKVDDEHAFVGLDAYKKVIDSGVNMVILATPPGFRSIHFAAAVEAGKHVFMEKPVCVDPAGARRVMEAGLKAKEKKLAVVAGTQRRHQKGYVETVKAIHDGAIGEVVSGCAYWNGGGVWVHPRKDGWTDLEWQMRNWYYFTWLCGDHIVEQHIHNIDVMNWVLRAHPVKATAVGGRQVRTGPEFGHIYDHFGVDYEYPNGVHVLSMCRHWPNTPGNVSEHVVGTKGKSNGHSSAGDFKAAGGGKNPYVQEHTDLVESIRKGEPLNEAQQVAESSLAAVMGREAAYTGQVVVWDDFLKSDMDLMPKNLDWNMKLEVPPVAMPGKRG
jgi:predicted dehydrogenase